ncbi:HD domain-containing phosphohydrolase [Plesiomonas sp.]|uniref:HD domain-containing phosphohydrolase n=1 Tax=Plesiomonas sp. TaxID=2486279 RepID=UPI003F407E5B
MALNWRNKRYPLQIQIAALFSLLLFLIGVLLIGFSYYRTNKLNIENTHTLYNYIGNRAASELELNTRTLGVAVNLLTTMPITTFSTLEQRFDSLPRLREILLSSPYANAVYCGYADGDMLLMRRVAKNALSNWNAPEGTAWIVQSLDHNGDTVRRNFLFFDYNLKLLRSDEKPEYLYDPRERPWYKLAKETSGLQMAPMYVFSASREVGTTISREAQNQRGVIGIDISLKTFSDLLKEQDLPPGSKMALINPQNKVVASLEPREVFRMDADRKISMSSVDTLPNPALSKLLRKVEGQPYTNSYNLEFESMGQMWFGSILPIKNSQGIFRLAIATPSDVLLASSIEIRNQSTLIAILVLFTALPIVWWISCRISRPLRQLRQDAEQIRRFNFEQPQPINSVVLEIDELARTTNQMRGTIQQFLNIGNSLAAERDFTTLLSRLMQETTKLVGMEGGVIYLPDRDSITLTPALWQWQGHPQSLQDIPTIHIPSMKHSALQQALQGHVVHQQLTQSSTITELSSFTHQLGDLDAVMVAMRNRDNQLIGMLVLLNPHSASQAIEPAKLKLVEALAGSLSVSVETQRLLQEQKNLLNAFIQLMAGAIDAKSAYTGGHCQRVPEITEMLAEAAVQAQSGPFADFSLSDEEREELHIASWLHDCGKVTTPEFVVDKATKLETMYDRLNEIRMRIEVLKRDAKISALEQQLSGVPHEQTENLYQQQIHELDDDFLFLAESNVGGEFMSDERLARINKIAERRWLRTLDNRIGLSHEEQQRKARVEQPSLPVWEHLLADREDHIFYREARDRLPEGHGFQMQEPQYLYNRGEIYNLSIRRGTLTDEERYKINEHIVQTIVMLKTLPFPRTMSHVPEIAGGHHERLDGNGYPCRLKKEQMSLTARMMAIADVFEALTAVDRPYKKGKTLTESLGIMAGMVKGQHLDAELFTLFLQSGIWLDYAQRYMRPEQIDEVDIARFLPVKTEPDPV